MPPTVFAGLTQEFRHKNSKVLTPTSRAIRNELTSPLPLNYEKRLQSVDSKSPTKLVSLIENKKWDEVTARLESLPKEASTSEASTWVVERDENNKVTHRYLPLHRACENYPPEDVIKTIIAANPRALQLKNGTGSLPLHTACSGIANASIITILLKYYPEGAQIRDAEGRLPLHLASRQWAEIESIQGLLLAYETAAKVADDHGLLPLHWACAQNASLEVVETLLFAFSDCVNTGDMWGRTPVRLADMSANPEKEDIVSALKKALKKRNRGRGATHPPDEPMFIATFDCDEAFGDDDDGNSTPESGVSSQTTDNAVRTSASVLEEYGQNVHALEAKLLEVTTTSSAAATAFRNLRDQLTAENKDLKSRVRNLASQNEEQEQQIGELLEENISLKEGVSRLLESNRMFQGWIDEWQTQRSDITDMSHEWEVALSEAHQLVN